MFADIIVATLFRQFHREVDDAVLDRAAVAAGCASGIGRMSLLSDQMLTQVIADLRLSRESRIADIGCGRGFLGRWLRSQRIEAHYTGIDSIREALIGADKLSPHAEFIEADYRTFVPETPYEAAVAFETNANGVVDDALLSAVRRCLRDGGRFAVTAISTDGLEERVAKHFSSFVFHDYTNEATEFARGLYEALAASEGWSHLIRPRIQAQARDVLTLIDSGRFRYTVVTGEA